MKTFFKFTSKDRDLLKAAYNFAKTKRVKLYLVGGILRDLILCREKENPDFDFCIKKGAINFGRALAKEIKSGFVVLDREHGACRLVKRINNKVYTLDFTDFRGRDLETDLKHRDFTINALALDLQHAFEHSDLNTLIIDPYLGRNDLQRKIIRVLNKKTFSEDPLRILRAFSFACVLGFKVDKETLRLVKLEKEKLSRVSPERIRDELFKIFGSTSAFDYLMALDRLGVLTIIIPEIEVMRKVKQGPYHHLDVLQHSFETLTQLEALMRELRNNPDIVGYLDAIISSERRRGSLLKMAAFLHDIGKPQAKKRKAGKTTFYGHERIGLEISENIARRIKLSNDEIESLRKMIFWHLRPGYMADNQELTQRAIFRYFRDTNNEAVSVLLLSIADQRATKGRLTTRQSRINHEKMCLGLIREYFRRKKEKKMPRLINGNDLIKKFKLEPSPLIGKILFEIEELQAIGRIKTKQDAFRIAKRFKGELE
jgi:poly(A) polymerase